MLAPKTLMLVANPWAAIDANGRPCGACRRDPVEDNAALGYIGARLESQLIAPGSVRKVGRHEQVVEYPRYEREWVFDPNPVRVPNTAYYRDRTAKAPHELFPGDAQTAKYLGFKSFNSAAELIEAHRRLRIAEFDAQHGEGSWQQLEDERNPPDTTAPLPTPAKSGKNNPKES